MNLTSRKVTWIAAAIVVVNGFFPAVWILLTSFKTETELLQVPITYLPQAPTLDNYVMAFTAQPILRFMWNSVVVAGLSTALCVLVSALAALMFVISMVATSGYLRYTRRSAARGGEE